MNQDFRPHPILVNYEFSADGVVRNRRLKKPIGFVNNQGYLQFGVRGRIYYVHRVVYEAFNGLIKDGNVIDHIDSNPLNNAISNLQCISQKENTKKGKTGKYPKRPRGVKSFDTTTNEERVFHSMNAARKHFDICSSSIRNVAEGVYQTAISKLNGRRIKFSYA